MNAKIPAAVAAFTLAGCVGTSAAFSDTPVLPSPSFLIGQYGPGVYYVQDQDWDVPGPGTYGGTYEGPTPIGTTTTALTEKLIGEPFPSVYASAQITGTIPCCNQSGRSGDDAEIVYDVEFSGPAAYATVDVSGWYEMTATGPGNAGYGESVVNLIVNGNPTWGGYTVVSAVDTFGASYFSESLSLPTGTPIDVYMQAEADVGDWTPWSASAYLDPYFSIDPSTPDAAAYSIVTSLGVGNAPSPGIPGTPEPSTWAMMLAGFAGLSFAGWRGRASKRAQA